MTSSGTRTLTRRALIEDAPATLRLAFPLIAGQLSQMLMGVADTAMIGRVGVTELAAAAFVTNLSYIPFVFGIGVLTAISVKVSQARGAGTPDVARAVLRHGLWVALGTGGMTVAAAWIIPPFLGQLGQDPAVVAATSPFLQLIAISLVPALLGMAVKNHADAMNRPWPPFWITLAGVLLNVLLNWVLIYGNLGCPALGLTGAGLATLTARLLIFIGIIVWCRTTPALQEWIPRRWFRRPVAPELMALIRLGLPSAVQMLAEVSAFVAAGLLIGTLGKEALAAHQIAMVCAATIFMVPLGLSMAVTVRIGAAVGAGDHRRPRLVLGGALLLAGGFTVASLIAILFGRWMIAGWFVSDSATLGVAAGLLLISAIFQTSDAIQVISAGALRGLEDVDFPARASFTAHWLIGLPLGWFLAFRAGMGVDGIWWGLTAGLTACAVLFNSRFWIRSTHAESIGRKIWAEK